MTSICNGWEYVPEWSGGFLRGEIRGEEVRLPHTVCEVPLHYSHPGMYEKISGYRKTLKLGEEYRDRRLFLRFDGAAHIADVFVNGTFICQHRCGYTAFEVEITDYVNLGEDNVIAVKLDSTENSEIPPFGFVIDYLTYGGLYREVWLDSRPQTYISDIYLTTPSKDELRAEVTLSSPAVGMTLRARVSDGDRPVAEAVCPAGEKASLSLSCPGVELWTLDNPKLYTCAVTLEAADGEAMHEKSDTFGFRTGEFKTDGFYLNGEKIFLRGLNRHQSFPYINYAAPERLQREDARILKNELCCNAVRTSHYPQSRHFIDECDRIGLLVFTEIPGWQHIGGDDWKAQAVENTREMVMQYRNRPSIILWGVRINESQDDDEFYSKTNAVARELDPTRQTSGVRYLENSSLLEDVYAYNDFSHDGTTPGCRKKSAVMKDASKPLIITECNGHMYPTKSFDTQSKRQEHALRHARVLDAAMADGEHAGCFQWCMFDYPTHRDFGSGDRVCHHGVTDAFRNPKTAASLYSSQGDAVPFIDVSSSMDIGDYPAGKIDRPYVFTNADEVELYKDDVYVSTFRPSAEWKGLKHGPVKIDDFIGQLVYTQEPYKGRKADFITDCIKTVEREGFSTLSLTGKLKFAWAMLRFGLTFDEGYRLYSKYIGNWGGEATRWRFDAKKDGKVVASVLRTPTGTLKLDVRSGSTELSEGDTYDMTLVRVRILDGCGMTAAYAQLPVSFTVEGAAELAGPATATAEGGMTGCYVRTCSRKGSAVLTVSAPGLESVKLEFKIN